jgi:long-chain acyl-CoA synthetase
MTPTRPIRDTRESTMNDDVLHGPGYATLSIASILFESAQRHPDRTAVIWAGNTGPDASVTYRDLWAETRAVAGVLRERGIGPGDRVAMMVPNVPAFPRIYYAVLALGAVVVPIHLLFKRDEIGFVLKDSGATLLVLAASSLEEALPAAAAAAVDTLSVLVPDEMRDRVPVPRVEDLVASATPIERLVPTSPLDAATLLYTSGTTGTPKGAVASHLSIVEQVNVTLLDLFDVRVDDVMFGGLPLFHTFGQTCVLNTAFRRGATIVLLPKFEPAAALAAMVEHDVTVFEGVPTMYVALLRAAAAGAALPTLRYAISGGAPLPLSVLEGFQKAFGAPVHEGYGLTETSPVVSFNAVGEPIHPGTIGRRIWGVEVDVVDAEREDALVPLARGEVGELIVRGHNLFKGYLGRPDATSSAVIDGWFRTGDLATIDDDDLITIVDRKKDMILRNGYNVYPTEVEAVLVQHPDVLTAAVFGVPHESHGQEVVAAVVLNPGAVADAAALTEFMSSRVAAYKYPRVFHFVEDLPLGPSGKVLKRELTRVHGGNAAAE